MIYICCVGFSSGTLLISSATVSVRAEGAILFEPLYHGVVYCM